MAAQRPSIFARLTNIRNASLPSPVLGEGRHRGLSGGRIAVRRRAILTVPERASVHIHANLIGAALALKKQPTTAPSRQARRNRRRSIRLKAGLLRRALGSGGMSAPELAQIRPLMPTALSKMRFIAVAHLLVCYDQTHWPRRIGLRPCDARYEWDRGSARGQMQKLSAGKFHRDSPRHRRRLLGGGDDSIELIVANSIEELHHQPGRDQGELTDACLRILVRSDERRQAWHLCTSDWSG
jgi:hypothetical protein